MTLYAESSAVLAWLLEQPLGQSMADALAEAEFVIASDLTLVECDRTIIRATALGQLREADAAQRQAHLQAVSARWTLLSLDDEVTERARRPFPVEPIRTLDAVHVSSAIVARKAVPDLAMLSLDDRVRSVAARLGIPLVPPDSALRR